MDTSIAANESPTIKNSIELLISWKDTLPRTPQGINSNTAGRVTILVLLNIPQVYRSRDSQILEDFDDAFCFLLLVVDGTLLLILG